jgi:hypothetical protein
MKIVITKNVKVITVILLGMIVIASFLYIVFFQLFSSEQINEAKGSPFLADKGNVALLSIGDEIDMQKLESEIKEKGVYPKIRPIWGLDGDLKELNKEYPQLKIEKKPAYFVFNSKGMIYKTYNYNGLFDYLVNYKY